MVYTCQVLQTVPNAQKMHSFIYKSPKIGNNSNIQHQGKGPTQMAHPFSGIPVPNTKGVSWTLASSYDTVTEAR